jgi:hypothetical protein
MILAVEKLHTSHSKLRYTYSINEKLCSYRYRFDLGLEDKPDKLIILLRTGNSSTSGHYLLLAETPTEHELKALQDGIKDLAFRTDLSTSELSVLEPSIYSE